MNEIDVLEVFLTEIESDLGLDANMAWGIEEYDGDDVVFEDWDSQRIRLSTSPFSGIVTDDTGNEIGERRKFFHQMRVEAKIYSEDELTAMERQNAVKKHFRKYEGNASDFHADAKRFEVVEGGNEKPKMEPTSLRQYLMIQKFDIWYVDIDIVEPDAEPIETFEDRFEINGEDQTI